MRPKKVILCIDHHEQDLSVLSFMLSTNGYRVLAATGAAQALELFAGQVVDLVLADCSTPH
ncbi:MAG: response regulator, partial [Terriglobales bacterium]